MASTAYTNLNYLFYRCESLDAPNMNLQNVAENVKTMDYAFYGAGVEGTTTFDNQKMKFASLVSCDSTFTDSKFGFKHSVFQFCGANESEDGKSRFVSSLKGLFSGNRWLASIAPTVVLSKSALEIDDLQSAISKNKDGSDYFPSDESFCGGNEADEIYGSGIYDFSNLYSNTSIKEADIRGISRCMSNVNTSSETYSGKIDYSSMFENCGNLESVSGHIPPYGYTYERMFNNCSSLEIDLSKSFMNYVKTKDSHVPSIVLSAQYAQSYWWWYGGWCWDNRWWNTYYYYGNLSYQPYYNGWYNGYYYNYYRYYNNWYGGWYGYPAYWNAWYGYTPYYNNWYGWGNWYRGGWHRCWWRYGYRGNTQEYGRQPDRRRISVDSSIVGRTVAARTYVRTLDKNPRYFDVGRVLTAEDVNALQKSKVGYVWVKWEEADMQGWGVDESEKLNGFNSLTCKNTTFNNIDSLMFKVDGNFELSFYWKAKLPYKNGLIYMIDDLVDYPYSYSANDIVANGANSHVGETVMRDVTYRPLIVKAGETITDDTVSKFAAGNVNTVKVYASGSSGNTIWKNASVSKDYVAARAVYSNKSVLMCRKDSELTSAVAEAIDSHNADVKKSGVGISITSIQLNDSEKYRIRKRRVVTSKEYTDTWENVQYSTVGSTTDSNENGISTHIVRIFTQDNVAGSNRFNTREWCFSNFSLKLENGGVVEPRDFEENNPVETVDISQNPRQYVGKWLAEDVLEFASDSISAKTLVTEEMYEERLSWGRKGEDVVVIKTIAFGNGDTQSEYDDAEYEILSENVDLAMYGTLSAGHEITSDDVAILKECGIASVNVYNTEIVGETLAEAVESCRMNAGYVIKYVDLATLVGEDVKSVKIKFDKVLVDDILYPLTTDGQEQKMVTITDGTELNIKDNYRQLSGKTLVTPIVIKTAESANVNDELVGRVLAKAVPDAGTQFTIDHEITEDDVTTLKNAGVTGVEVYGYETVFEAGDKVTYMVFNSIVGRKLAAEVKAGEVYIPKGTRLNSDTYRNKIVGRLFPTSISTAKVVALASGGDRHCPLTMADINMIRKAGVRKIKVQDYGETPGTSHLGEYILAEECDNPIEVGEFQTSYYKTSTLDGYEPSSIAYMFNDVKRLYSTNDNFDLAVLVKKTAETLENAILTDKSGELGIKVEKKHFEHAFPITVIAMNSAVPEISQVSYDITDISKSKGIMRYCSFSNADDNAEFGLNSKYMKWCFPNGFVRYGGVLQSNKNYYLLVPYYPVLNASGETTEFRPWYSTNESKLNPDGIIKPFNVCSCYRWHDDWEYGARYPWSVLHAETHSSCTSDKHRARGWSTKATKLFAALVYDKSGAYIGKRYVGTWSQGIYLHGWHSACHGSYDVTSSEAHPVTIYNGTITTPIPDVGSKILHDGSVDSREAVEESWYTTFSR